MNHYGTLRDFRFSDKDVDDIRGSDVYGQNDDKLGDIDDVIFDHSTGDIRYVVVDTGGWLSSNKFLVPADRLQPSSKHDDDYQVNLSKDQIQNFPPYDEKSVSDNDRWNDYETRYNAGWTTDGDVQHREDAVDRNITPRADEMSNAGTSTSRNIPSSSTTRTTSTVASTRPTGASDSLRNTGQGQRENISSGTGARTHLGQRWNNFESRLRTDRTRIVGACGVCGIGPSSAAKDRDRDRKLG